MPAEGAAIRRVVIGFDPAPPDAGALRVAADLAAALGVELVGLYVEDERLLRLAQLPFAREFGFPSAHARPMQPGDIARSLRVQAERVRRLLAGAAGPLNLAWTLEVVRGELHRSALAATTLADLLVVAGAHAFAPPAAASGGPVVVLLDDSDAGRRALSLARTLCGATGGELIVLGAAPDLPRLERVVLAHRPAAILLPRGGEDAAERLSRARLPCPRVLVG